MTPPPDAPNVPRTLEPIAATEATLRQVQRLARLVRQDLRDEEGRPRFSLIGPHHESEQLPSDVLTLLQQLLTILASGDAVTVVPVHQELTTQEAANLLNVSRQYLVQLLDEGKIPFHRTGTHRRLYSKDVLEYCATRKAGRHTQICTIRTEASKTHKRIA